MSRGIIQAALRDKKASSQLEARELTRSEREVSSEQPTLADLVLPGSGHAFSDEFACLLNVLSAGEKSALHEIAHASARGAKIR